MKDKEVIVRVKFGKGIKSRIKEYRFSTRKSAEIFCRCLKYNPKCTTYHIIG